MLKPKPKIGFCVINHPLEVGAEESLAVLKQVSRAFKKYHIELIVYEGIINNDSDMQKAGKYFYKNEIESILVIQTTWSNDHHVTDLLEYVDVPACLWAIPGMENGSLCGIHQLGVVLYELGKKYKIFYGPPEDQELHQDVLSFCKAAGLQKYLRKQKIGLIGYRVPGMTEVAFDELECKRIFGPRVNHFGINEILDRSNKIEEGLAKKVWQELQEKNIHIRVNDQEGISSCKNYLAIRDLAAQYDIKGFAVECYPELMGQVCLAASLLASEGIAVACEGDVNSALAMMVLYYLTGKPVHNTDLLNPDSEYSMVFSHCGSGDFSIAEKIEEIALCPVRLQECGVCVMFLPKLGEITLLNIVGRKSTYRISVIEAVSQETTMIFPGNPLSAKLEIPISRFLDGIASHAVGHHWMIGYGHVQKSIQYFSEMIDVRLIDFQ